MNVQGDISLENSDLVRETFDFWFRGQEHIRTPFPEYIRPELVKKSIGRLAAWLEKMSDQAAKEVNDVIVAEKFEEFVFETAMELVRTEDERITISYPFLPRVGDKITHDQGDMSSVTDRHVEKDGDQVFLVVKMQNEVTLEKKVTRFELPA